MEIRENEPLRFHTGLRMGGSARLLLIPEGIEGLRQAMVLSDRKNLPFRVIGNGTSVLVRPEGYDGMVIKMANVLNHIRIDKDRVYVGAGALMTTLLRQAMSHGLSGLEHWWGCPSTVGGWLTRMGLAKNPYLDHLICEVYVMEADGFVTRLIEPSQLFDDGYQSQRVVVEVVFQLRSDSRDEMKRQIEKRQAEWSFLTQTQLPLAGPVFLTNEEDLTEIFVEKKVSGFRRGKAAFLGIGSGYVANLGDATYQDVINLLDEVKQKINDRQELQLIDGLSEIFIKEVV